MEAKPTQAPQSLRVTAAPTRRAPWVALGLLIVFGSGLAFALWADSLGDRQEVVVAAHAIPAGSTISAGDLATIGVATDGSVPVVPAGERSSLLDQVARMDIAEGSLITPGQLGQSSDVAPGQAITSVLLEPGELPVPSLRAGDRVQVVGASPSDSLDDSIATGLLSVADVYAVTTVNDSTGSVSVSLLIPEAEAVTVAEAVAADGVRLALVSQGQADR